MSSDAVRQADELAAYYARLPRMPPPGQRHEAAEWQCFAVPVLLSWPEERALVADTFGDGHRAARALLAALADVAAPPFMAYDNLDQGWALQIQVERDEVFALDWDWESDDAPETARAWRFSRQELARQAEAARQRLDYILPILIAATGMDLWVRQHRAPRTPARSLTGLWKRLVGSR